MAAGYAVAQIYRDRIMARLEHLHKVEYVEYIPPVDKMKQGVLYVSLEFCTAAHLCACGCGQQSVTPLGGEHGWQYNSNGVQVTLAPSILNTNCPNRAHYFIRDSKIIWV